MDLLLPLRIIWVTVLITLPGAWISFGLPFNGLAFWMRLLMGMVLTPLVLAVQFYILRWMGASFEVTAVLLTIVNLPVLYLLLRARFTLPRADAQMFAAVGLVLVIVLASFAPFLFNTQERIFSWDAWMHSDIIYALANGNLVLEDPELAGVILSYPWAGHIYQGVFSYLLGTPPASGYIWVNLVWLAIMFGFAAGMVAELGGKRLSRVAVIPWLSFGVNFAGFVLSRIVPASLANAHHVLLYIEGDDRYTPWLDKVVAFSQMYFGLGIFFAIAFLTLKRMPDGQRRYYILLAGLLLCSLGIIYSVLLPPALVLVGSKALVMLASDLRERRSYGIGTAAGMGVVLLVSVVVTVVQVWFLAQGRAGASLINWNEDMFRYYEAIITLVIMSPLLAGYAFAAWRSWRTNVGGLFMLGLGALASCTLYIVFDVPWWRNEYKFIFTAAICLAPFPALALEPLFNRLGRLAIPALAVLTILLASPFAEKTYMRAYYYYTRPGPEVDTSHFDLYLDGQHPYAGLIAAIRNKTPIDSLLVLEDTTVHYPTLTRRQLYVAPPEIDPQPGILVTSDEMLTLVKAYPRELIDERRATVRDLFDSNDPVRMGAALERMLQFGRPLVLMLDAQKQTDLRQWLTKQGIRKSLYDDGNKSLWLVNPGTLGD